MPATTDDGLFKHTYDAWNRLNDESLQDSAILPDPDVIADFPVSAGTTYYIQVAGWQTGPSDAVGAIVFNVGSLGPANDTCDTAESIFGEGMFPWAACAQYDRGAFGGQ